jgi:hypothetical protein
MSDETVERGAFLQGLRHFCSEEICLNLSLEIGVPVSQGGAQAWGEAAVDGMLDMPLLGLGVGPEVGRTHLVL